VNIDIIVPVLGRPEHAATFVGSLDHSGVEDHRVHVYPMCENQDDLSAWDRFGYGYLGAGHTFAEKVNYGYKLTDAEWVLLVGTDVKFHQGWIDRLEDVVRHMPEACVLGTKDLGNPRVTEGTHTCHPVISRAYIDQVGSSWDGPGVVCHEYRHCFVDDEIVTVAKQRGVWSPTKAVIEHMHPYWDKGEYDEVYQEGESWMEIDRFEWIRRVKEYAPEVLT
jgi:hypothetical protein